MAQLRAGDGPGESRGGVGGPATPTKGAAGGPAAAAQGRLLDPDGWGGAPPGVGGK